MLSQAVGYAVCALGYLAVPKGGSRLVRDVASACAIPGPYLSKIVHSLAKAGIVSTQRGLGGGVALAKDAAAISLWDVCVALADPVTESRCMLGSAQCSDDRCCPVHRFFSGHREAERAYLRGTTIADIASYIEKSGVSAGIGDGMRLPIGIPPSGKTA